MQTTSLKHVASILLILAWGFLAADVRAADEGQVTLFNGKDLTGWKMRDAKNTTTWKVVSKAELDPANPKAILGSGEGGSADSVMLRPAVEHGTDIISEKVFGDCQLHIEFMVAKGTNSGVYMMGNYEIQVLDSAGKPDNQLSPGDGGGIYNTKAPGANGALPVGQWQTYDVTFRAPRFDADGKKTENARFVRLVYNGKTIHENVEVPKGTGGQISADKPTGPIMLQGDHGVVAFRNITVKPLELK